jgi:hypothetical protein
LLPEPVAAPVGRADLPELSGVWWRPRADAERLRRRGRRWTISALASPVPMVGLAVLLAALNPLAIPLSLVLLAHAWIVPELTAARGAKVVRRRAGASDPSERVALGLLGDLLGHDARALHAGTGLALERGALGTWLLGEAGALLVAPGGRRVYCFCVRVNDPELPPSDRVSHLLLALREDETGFATVANLAFSGATWRVRRRLAAPGRSALAAARALAREAPAPAPAPALRS